METDRHHFPELILASQSPRRRELLMEAGYRFRVIVPAETAENGGYQDEEPAQMVARLAYQKAADVAGVWRPVWFWDVIPWRNAKV